MAAGAALAAERGAAEGAEPLSPGTGATGSPGVAGGREQLGMQEPQPLLWFWGA